MANSNEIVQIDQIDKGLTALNATINITAANYLKLVKTIADGSVTIQANATSNANLNTAQRQTATNTQQLDALGRQLAASEQRLRDLTDARTTELLRNRLAIQQQTAATNAQVRAEQAEEGSLIRMRQRLSELTSAYDRTGVRTAAATAEINTLSRSIGEAEAATNRHQRGVGGYADQLGRLPGPIGGAVSGFSSLAKSMWALVANPIGAFIALIVGGLTALYKAFTSTDEGATAFAGILKAIGNVMDVVIDRTWSFFKLIGSIATFDFDGIKENAKGAFDGIGKSLKDAAKAGWDYEQQMDRIKDAEAASLTRAANLRKEIQELTVASKDRGLGSKEQIRLAELAMSKAIELNGIERGFQEDRTKQESSNLAAKIQNNKLSTESKQKQLEDWLKIDDKELASALANNKEFAKFYNENEDDFQALQKAKSEDIDKQTELVRETKRLNTSLFTFQEQLRTEDKAAAKAALDARANDVEAWNSKEIASIKQRYVEGKISEEQYNQELIDLQVRYLNKKLSLYKMGSKEYEAVQVSLVDILIKNEDDANKAILDLNKTMFDDQTKIDDEVLKNQIDNDTKSIESSTSAIEKIKEAEKKAAEDKIELKKEIRDKEIEIASTAINGIFDLGSAKRDEELAALDKEKAAKLANKNLTEAQKLKIEQEYDKKAAVIKTKQAKADKLQAMFNIALSTAMGAMNAASKVVTLPLVPFIIALGAVQLALAAAQPIPKFAKGTKNAPERGIFGEAGLELMSLRSGEVMAADKPTYFEGNKFKGAQILSNPETEKLIRQNEYHSVGGRQMTDERILQGLNKVERAIRQKPVAIYDTDHRTIGFATDHHKEIYLNRLIRK